MLPLTLAGCTDAKGVTRRQPDISTERRKEASIDNLLPALELSRVHTTESCAVWFLHLARYWMISWERWEARNP